MLAEKFKVFRDEQWVEVPEPEWEAFHGLRQMTIPWGEVGYHGPVRVDGKVSTAVRACRCDTCTLFEESRRSTLSPNVLAVVNSML